MQLLILHRYVAEIRPEGGTVISTPPLEVDWMPAIEWTHFQEVRRGAASFASVPEGARIRPQWDEQSGRPYVASIAVSAWNVDSARSEEIPLQYLAAAVRRAVNSLVAEGRVTEGTKYTWRICAFDAEPGDGGGPQRNAFTIEEVPEAAEGVSTRRLGDLLRLAVHQGPARDSGTAADFPVFIARPVLDEAATAATAAGDLEAGGVLLGRLSRDEDSGDLVLEVTAQVPAREAVADDASLRFTPATWQAVLAVIALRRANERIIGWYHSHPTKTWPCHACPPARRAECPSSRTFFSGMDVAFHRTAFPGPINIALLVSFLDEPVPRLDLFGWRQGLIAARDYYVLEKAHDD